MRGGESVDTFWIYSWLKLCETIKSGLLFSVGAYVVTLGVTFDIELLSQLGPNPVQVASAQSGRLK